MAEIEKELAKPSVNTFIYSPKVKKKLKKIRGAAFFTPEEEKIENSDIKRKRSINVKGKEIEDIEDLL